MSEEAPLVVEAEGETVGEAKWVGLRELERLYPGLDRESVTFEVISSGERGLLGVGMAPARVLARFDPASAPPAPAAPVVPPRAAADESDRAALVREMLAEIAHALGADCGIDVEETGESIAATLDGPDVAVLIGKRGKTIDSIQYLIGAAIANAGGEAPAQVTVDAAGYRDRRESRLAEVAARSAEQTLRTGSPIRLEPMTSVERKIVHMHLKDVPGIETHSEGDEPSRYVVVSPAGTS
jgi:spoIIIJ-associated protein